MESQNLRTDRFYYKVVKEVCKEVKEELIQKDIAQKRQIDSKFAKMMSVENIDQVIIRLKKTTS